MKKVNFLPSQGISEFGKLSDASGVALPFYGASIPAGFPNPAESWVERSLDLNDLCIRNPDSSYFVRVCGESMINAGIGEGDVLVIDRSLPHIHNAIVVARVGAELTVKRLQLKPVKRLVPENPAYMPIDTEGLDVEIIGVATFTIKRLLP
jgi:DNA polymerase V